MSKSKYLLLILVMCFEAVMAATNITVVGLFRDKALVTIDGKQQLLIVGKPAPDGIELISSNSKKAIIEINGEHHEFGLHDGITNHYQPPSGQQRVTLTPDEQGMYWVDGKINDISARFVVDTGATLISMNKNDATRFGINYLKSTEKALSQTASGVDEVYIVNLAKVKMREIELYNVRAAVHDGDHPLAILLGNSFLNKIDMKREGRILQFQKK